MLNFANIIGILILVSSVYGDGKSLKLAAESNQLFSKNFFHAVGNENPGNLICSPLSAQLGLGMTRLGARGETKGQLTSNLGLLEDENENNNAFIALRNELLSENNNSTTIQVVNKIFAANNFSLIPETETISRQVFDTEISSVNFVDPKTVLEINKWVEDITENKIVNFIPEGSFDVDTKLVLVNALYFKGLWKQRFNGIIKDFFNKRAEGDKAVKTTFMQTNGNFSMKNSYEGLDAGLLVLPYKGDTLSLVIVLPHENTNLNSVESQMKDHDLKNLINKTNMVEDLKVTLPKFTMEVTLELEEPLKQMGIKKMFEGGADLTGFSNSPNSRKLFVSKVTQKCVIEITEDGTVAAAATQSTVQLESVQRVQSFDVNRPFLFYLVHHKNSEIPPIELFSGRYVTPPSS